MGEKGGWRNDCRVRVRVPVSHRCDAAIKLTKVSSVGLSFVVALGIVVVGCALLSGFPVDSRQS